MLLEAHAAGALNTLEVSLTAVQSALRQSLGGDTDAGDASASSSVSSTDVVQHTDFRKAILASSGLSAETAKQASVM